MNRHDTAKQLVTNILERHPEVRSSPLEVLRLVYYSQAYKAKISRSRIDTTIDTIQKFNAAEVNMETHLRALREVQNKERPDLRDHAAAAERAAIAAEYREHFSPKDDDPDDPDQTTLF